MEVIRSANQLPLGISSCVAIGKFDGLHLGHQQLIHELTEHAQEHSLTPIVISFDRHPMALFDPANCPKPIIGAGQKAQELNRLGVEYLLQLEFDAELASLTPKEFLARYVQPLKAQMVFVGQDFAFGSGGKGGVADLRELGQAFGFRVREVPHVLMNERKIASSDIRQLLDLGRVDVVAALLGRNHEVTGVVEHGKKLGRTFGFPTANFSRDSEGYLPQDGVYAGYLHVDSMIYPAAHSVGTNDSVAEVPRLLESHVIGRDDLDLYGKTVTAEFVTQVRSWAKFESIDQLLKQIAKDVSDAKEILGE
jgi:riboflavin kinase/FMN adenylyltransferase